MKTETKKIIGIILAVCVVFAMTFLVAAGYSFEVGAYAEEYDFGDADSEFIENAVALAKDNYVGDIPTVNLLKTPSRLPRTIMSAIFP